MNFKIHLIIIATIIGAIFAARILMPPAPQPAPQPIVEKQEVSDYYISVAHASWGVNCSTNRVAGEAADTNAHYRADSEAAEASKTKEDNVILAVSNLCNGRSKCIITPTPDVLGDDPAPNCPNKTIKVDYRCFAIDRLRTAQSTAGNALSIDCEKQLK